MTITKSAQAGATSDPTPGRSGLPRQVNIHEAKTHLSALLAEVEQGHEVTIARAGKPIAKLVPTEPKPRRKFGGYHFVNIPDSVWFDPLPEEELLLWEGRGDEIPGYEDSGL